MSTAAPVDHEQLARAIVAELRAGAEQRAYPGRRYDPIKLSCLGIAFSLLVGLFVAIFQVVAGTVDAMREVAGEWRVQQRLDLERLDRIEAVLWPAATRPPLETPETTETP